MSPCPHACLVQGQRVRHCTHAELPDAKAHIALRVAVLQEVTGALHPWLGVSSKHDPRPQRGMSKQQGHVGGCQVGRATHELWQHIGDGIEAVLSLSVALRSWTSLRLATI